jgi:hypothetical protein
MTASATSKARSASGTRAATARWLACFTRLLTADMAPLLHSGGRREPRATAPAGPLRDLATAAGYQVESAGKLPLLRYIVAVRPQESAARPQPLSTSAAGKRTTRRKPPPA